jgi:hypothetical protein
MGEEPSMRASPEEVRSATKQVEDMYLAGTLPELSYYKCLVTLASEWLINHENTDEALILLNQCPATYYSDILGAQLKQDVLFAKVVVELVHKIIQYGIVDYELYEPTMPVGKA